MVLLVLLASAAPAAAAAAAAAVPGYAVQEQRGLVGGVEYAKLVKRDGPVVAHVVRVAPDAGVKLRTVLSNDRVAGPAPLGERTSEMCKRVRCVAAVNGDFYVPETFQPLGAMVSQGRLLRSPVPSHHQLSLDSSGGLSAETLDWSGQLVPSDLRPLPVGGVNVDRGSDALVLYTSAQGATTGTNEFGVELLFNVLEPAPPLRLGQTALVELTGLADGKGNSVVPPGGAVLSGHGTAAAGLRELWARVETGTASRRALLRLETVPSVSESIGGTPILVHEGRRWVADDGSAFAAGRHPRTMVGWTANEVLLVTVDGRDPAYSGGLSLVAAADLMISLGAKEAINLDGGGSATMVVRGDVVNRPSDRLVKTGGRERIVGTPGKGDKVVGPVERPVANALAVVAEADAASPAVDPLSGASLQLPQELALPVPGGDPASLPGGLPALLTLSPPSGLNAVVVAVAATSNAVAAQAVLPFSRRRRRRRRQAPPGRSVSSSLTSESTTSVSAPPRSTTSRWRA